MEQAEDDTLKMTHALERKNSRVLLLQSSLSFHSVWIHPTVTSKQGSCILRYRHMHHFVPCRVRNRFFLQNSLTLDAGDDASGVASVTVWVVTTPDAAALVTVVVIVGMIDAKRRKGMSVF